MKYLFLIVMIVGTVIFSTQDIMDNPTVNMIISTLFGIAVASLLTYIGIVSFNQRMRYIKKHKKEKFRISYSYLIRLLSNDNKFILIRSEKNGKFQPVGGVYHMQTDTEKYWNDAGFNSDRTGDLLDFRGTVYGYKLKQFCKKIAKGTYREVTPNREFIEEVLILLTNEERLHFSEADLKFEYIKREYLFGEETFYKSIAKHRMNIYDIYNLKLSAKQLEILRTKKHKRLKAFTLDQIQSLGMNIGSNNHNPTINEHTRLIINYREEKKNDE